MRKTPKQIRSRKVVQQLLDATATCIAQRGLDHTTTNHIADLAGVSIGSLYQYFEHKEAMIEALLDKLGTQVSQHFRQRAIEQDFYQQPLQEVAFHAIRLGFTVIKQDPLMQEMVRNWNRIPIERFLNPLEHVFLVMAQPYFLKNYQNYPVQNLESKLYVLVNSTLFTAIRYLNQEQPAIDERTIINTLTDMIVGLLEADVDTH